MADLYWPRRKLCGVTRSFDPAPRTVSGGVGRFGVGQVVASDAVLGDGSVLISHLVATNQPPRNVTPISAPNNTTTDPATRHFWDFRCGGTSVRARAYSLTDSVLIDQSEDIAA